MPFCKLWWLNCRRPGLIMWYVSLDRLSLLDQCLNYPLFSWIVFQPSWPLYHRFFNVGSDHPNGHYKQIWQQLDRLHLLILTLPNGFADNLVWSGCSQRKEGRCCLGASCSRSSINVYICNLKCHLWKWQCYPSFCTLWCPCSFFPEPTTIERLECHLERCF